MEQTKYIVNKKLEYKPAFIINEQFLKDLVSFLEKCDERDIKYSIAFEDSTVYECNNLNEMIKLIKSSLIPIDEINIFNSYSDSPFSLEKNHKLNFNISLYRDELTNRVIKINLKTERQSLPYIEQNIHEIINGKKQWYSLFWHKYLTDDPFGMLILSWVALFILIGTVFDKASQSITSKMFACYCIISVIYIVFISTKTKFFPKIVFSIGNEQEKHAKCSSFRNWFFGILGAIIIGFCVDYAVRLII